MSTAASTPGRTNAIRACRCTDLQRPAATPLAPAPPGTAHERPHHPPVQPSRPPVHLEPCRAGGAAGPGERIGGAGPEPGRTVRIGPRLRRDLSLGPFGLRRQPGQGRAGPRWPAPAGRPGGGCELEQPQQLGQRAGQHLQQPERHAVGQPAVVPPGQRRGRPARPAVHRHRQGTAAKRRAGPDRAHHAGLLRRTGRTGHADLRAGPEESRERTAGRRQAQL